MDIHKNEKNELRLWSKDDIVPSDLQGLCKQAAGSIAKLQKRIKELEERLLKHLKGHSLEAICDVCSSHYWYVDDEAIVCPNCHPERALKG